MQCEVHGPVENGRFGATGCPPFLDDAVVKFLQQTRNGREDCGLAVGQILFDRLEAFRKVDVGSNVHVQVVEHALENVAHRQKAQHPVIRIGQHFWDPRDALHHGLGDVVVAEHDPLGRTRGTGRVNDGRQIFGLDRCHAGIEFGLLGVAARLGDGRPVVAVAVLEHEYVFQ